LWVSMRLFFEGMQLGIPINFSISNSDFIT
jgi:hypothetical protein